MTEENHSDENLNTKVKWRKLRSASFDVARDDIVSQGKCLCGQYVRARLKRAGVLNRKVTQRLRPMLDTPTTLGVRDVFHALNSMGEELERMHPRTYTNVSRQLSRSPFGELQEANSAPCLLHSAAKELFKNGINWGKVISLFAISGGLAIDIVRQGYYDYLQRLIEGTADIIEENLLPWLLENGGWSGLLNQIRRPGYTDIYSLGWISLFVAIIFTIYLLIYLIFFITRNIYSIL